jgi:hypothetical protein
MAGSTAARLSYWIWLVSNVLSLSTSSGVNPSGLPTDPFHVARHRSSACLCRPTRKRRQRLSPVPPRSSPLFQTSDGRRDGRGHVCFSNDGKSETCFCPPAHAARAAKEDRRVQSAGGFRLIRNLSSSAPLARRYGLGIHYRSTESLTQTSPAPVSILDRKFQSPNQGRSVRRGSTCRRERINAPVAPAALPGPTSC